MQMSKNVNNDVSLNPPIQVVQSKEQNTVKMPFCITVGVESVKKLTYSVKSIATIT